MKMRYLHPTEDNFNFSDADDFIDYANSKNMTVHGHALIWHSDYQVPDFMKVKQGDSGWSGTSTEFLTAVENHVTTIVNHFKDKNLISWDVVNEALDDGNPSNFRTDSAFYANSWLTTAIAAYQGEAIGWPLFFDEHYNDKPALRGFADALLGIRCTNL